MIDHIGIKVADFDRAKSFYDQALAPLDARLMMMVPTEYTGGVKIGGYGRDRPVYWLHEEKSSGEAKHVAFTARTRGELDASFMRRSRRVVRTTARRGCAPITTRTTTAPSFSTRTATISKRSATRLSERREG
ncbi:VOC family protein [Chelativorans sp. AA-79]|uniref:VOC family protein n=1 Tax=Chelativorans sp. AA-79 TaxID=3028735 RepID=UPI003211E30A